MDDRRERFASVALPFMRSVYGAALRFSGRPDVADDVTQETFLRAFRTFDNFAPGTNCKAWLLTIMRSVLVNRHYYEHRHPGTSIESVTDTEFAAVDPALAAIVNHVPAPEVEAALRALPDAFREAVVLVDLEELTYDEAARALDCPVGTLRSRLFRARRLLFGSLYEHAVRAGYVTTPEGRS
jgi:RNA polymerase sigma-70 factor (ECF subfamily)